MRTNGGVTTECLLLPPPTLEATAADLNQKGLYSRDEINDMGAPR